MQYAVTLNPYVHCFYLQQVRRSLEDNEKERQLQRKVSDLSTQVSRLERMVSNTKADNEKLVSLYGI